MIPSASMANAQVATSRVEEIARRAFCDGSRSLGGALRVRLAMWPNRSRAPVALCAVVPSGLTPSRASSIGCDPEPTVPVRALLAVLQYGRRARSMAHEDLRPSWAVATDRHDRMKSNYARRLLMSSERLMVVSRLVRNVPVLNSLEMSPC